MTKQFGLGKGERLKSRKQIDNLFASGRSINMFPLRITYQFMAARDEEILKAGVTVSKRYFKKAVDRNRIKRQLRESYRLQKAQLIQLLRVNGKSGNIFIIYTDKKKASFQDIYDAMGKVFIYFLKMN